MVKNTPLKSQKMERESLKECSFVCACLCVCVCVEDGKLFIKRSSFKEFNLVVFTLERMFFFKCN